MFCDHRSKERKARDKWKRREKEKRKRVKEGKKEREREGGQIAQKEKKKKNVGRVPIERKLARVPAPRVFPQDQRAKQPATSEYQNHNQSQITDHRRKQP